MDIDQVISAGLETAINKYLSLDPEGLSRFEKLQGHIIEIHIRGLNQHLFLFPSADGFLVLNEFDGEADVTISGTPIALAKLGLVEDARDVLFGKEISIEGDTRLANQFNRLLSQLDIDWEELLAKAVGDIAAHKAGNMARQMGQFITRAARSFAADGGEYLKEEARLSPSNAELRKFIQQVDLVREAADRLEARLQIIKQKLND